MRPETAKFELAAMQLGDQGKANLEVHNAFFQDAGLLQVKDGHKAKDSVVPTAPPKESDGPVSPMDRVGNALEAYMKEGKLSPELKKQFESAIADTDKGPSPAVAELTKKQESLTAELKALFPEDKQKEAKALQEGIAADLSKLPDDKKQQVGILLGVLAQAQNPDDQKKIVEAMQKIAPEAMDKMDKLDKLMEPVLKKAQELQMTSMALEVEKKDGVVTRVLYAQVCLDAGDDKTAAKYLREAANKDQSLLQDPSFNQLLEQAGLDAKSLKQTKI